MHFILTSVGSLGDVHPFIAIGQALQQRGHRATLLCNDDFEAEVARAGIGFAPAGPGVSLARATANPDLWHPIKGLGVFWRAMLAPAIEPTFRFIERIAASGERCAIVAPPALFGARFARERFGVPLVSAYTAPAVLRSDRAPLTMAHWRLPRGTPSALVRLAWRGLDRHKLHPMARATLQRSAAACGATAPPDDASIFGDWMHSPDGGVTLFPEWFAARRSGWPASLRFGDFPLYRGDAEAGLPDPLQGFLAAGAAPVVFMPGSAMRHGRRFFDTAVAACAANGWRAVLLGADAACSPPAPGVLPLPYAPFAALLPHAAALVHHGGIGSCAQALQAGVPQLIMPMAHDQFDNAACIRRLGAGDWLPPARFDSRRLAQRLRRLLDRPPARLQALAARCRTGSLQPACEHIEAIAAR